MLNCFTVQARQGLMRHLGSYHRCETDIECDLEFCFFRSHWPQSMDRHQTCQHPLLEVLIIRRPYERSFFLFLEFHTYRRYLLKGIISIIKFIVLFPPSSLQQHQTHNSTQKFSQYRNSY